MGISEIEKAVKQLSPEELVEFRRWFAEFDAQLWDKQIEEDSKAGRLDKLAEDALREHREGRSTDLCSQGYKELLEAL